MKRILSVLLLCSLLVTLLLPCAAAQETDGISTRTLERALAFAQADTSGALSVESAPKTQSANDGFLPKGLANDDNLILPGITLKHLLMLAEQNGIPTREAPFTMDELRNADEVIVSSSGGLCIQATELDGAPIGGRDPKNLKTLQDAYTAYYAQDVQG